MQPAREKWKCEVQRALGGVSESEDVFVGRLCEAGRRLAETPYNPPQITPFT
jgi:hypothetical protein